MNRACRHPEILQYSPKDLLEKKEKLDDNDSWDFIYDITTEPPVNYPPKPVRVHIFSIPKTNSNLCPQLVEARSNYEIWEKRLQGTWQDFWTYEENEKVLQKALKVVKPGTTHFYEDVVNFLNKYGKYPRQLKQNSLQRDEVMRKCWEKSEFTKNILHTILADENSLKKYHYAGVVGRQKEQRMADHEQTHGKCDFRKHESTSDKQTCLVTEIISISLLMSMENFALIGGCLNRSAGGDGSTAATTYRSEMYHNYSYDTMTPFEAQNSDQGHLRRVVTYKKMPEKFNKNGSRIIHAFCMTCYRWIHPLKLKTHNKRHYSKNVKCLECPRKFKTELSMKYHLKMSHTFVRCKKNHHNVRVNKTLSVDSWIRYHLTVSCYLLNLSSFKLFLSLRCTT